MPITGRQFLKGRGVPVRKRTVINTQARPVDTDTLTASEQRMADSVLEGFDLVPPTAFVALIDNPNDTTYEQAVTQALSQVETDIAAEYHAQLVMGGSVAAKELSAMLVDQFTALTQKADRPTPVEVAMRFSFNAQHPEALSWARQNAGRLVTNMAREQRDAVRALVADADGLTTPQRRASALNNLLRDVQPGTRAGRAVAQTLGANVNGLTKRYERAVFNNAQRIADDLAAQGITGTKALDIVRNKSDRYASKLRRSRARTISRTESMRALNEGRQQAWEQAAQQGLINKQTARKTWVTGPMDVCPTCQPLNGTSVPLDGKWQAGGVAVRTPPAHPNCRCSMTIVTLPIQQPRGLGTGSPGNPYRIDYGPKPKLDDYPPLPQPGDGPRVMSLPQGPTAPRFELPPRPDGSRLVSPGGDVSDFYVTPDGRVRIESASLERDAQAVWRRFTAQGDQEEFIPARNSVAGRVERHIRRNPDTIKPGPQPIITPPRVPQYEPLTEADVRALVARQRNSGVTRDALPQYESAIVQYTNGSGDYHDINLSLRRGDWFPQLRDTQQARIGGMVNDLDDVIELSPRLDQPTLLYRGVKDEGLPVYLDLRVGDVVTESGYSSTSVSREVADRFANPSNAKRPGIVLEIEAPPGTKAVQPLAYRTGDEAVLFGRGYNEAEVLLQRGTKFQVVKVDGNVVRLRIIEQPKPARFYTKVDPVDPGRRVVVPPDGNVPGHVFEPDGRVFIQGKDEYRDQAGVWYRKLKGSDTYEPFTPARNSAAGHLDRHLKRTGPKPTPPPAPTATTPTLTVTPTQTTADPLAVDISDLKPRIDKLNTTTLQRRASQYEDWTPTGEQDDALQAVIDAGERVETRVLEQVVERTKGVQAQLDEANDALRRARSAYKRAEDERQRVARNLFHDQLRAAGINIDRVPISKTTSDVQVLGYKARQALVEELAKRGDTPATRELLDIFPSSSRMADWSYDDQVRALQVEFKLIPSDPAPPFSSSSSGYGWVKVGDKTESVYLANPAGVAQLNAPYGHQASQLARETLDEVQQAVKAQAKVQAQMEDAVRDVVRDVLQATRPNYGNARSVRDLFYSVRGSRTVAATDKATAEALTEVQQYFPAEWIDAWRTSAESRVKSGSPLRWLLKFGQRGHYDHSNAEVWLSGTDWRSTLTHEMGHGMDYTNKGLGRAHALFYRRRMKQLGIKDTMPQTRIYKGKKEYAWDLKLRTDVTSSNLYSSKTYDRETSWELLTMALEELWHRPGGHFWKSLDPEYRRYILGLLVGL